MVCPKCECYYEYKGEVCLENGRLQVKYADCLTSRIVMERMIGHLTGIEETKSSEEKEKTRVKHKQTRAVEEDGQLYLFAV